MFFLNKSLENYKIFAVAVAAVVVVVVVVQYS